MIKTVTLETEFDKAMEGLYYAIGREIRYWANYYLRELRAKGGVACAKAMLARPPSPGLSKLEEAGRLDLSVEWLVLNPKFAPLFSDDERVSAYNRLSRMLSTCKAIP